VVQWRIQSLGGDLGARPVSSSRGIRILGPMRTLVSPSDSILVSLHYVLNSYTSLSMYLFCNSITHVITFYSGHVCVYYASTLRCWHLIWILVSTDHPCLGVEYHNMSTNHFKIIALYEAAYECVWLRRVINRRNPHSSFMWY
jgi:hypothetical protein